MGVTLTPSPSNSIRGIIKKEVKDVNLTIDGYLAWGKNNKSKNLEEFLTLFLDYYRDEMEAELL